MLHITNEEEKKTQFEPIRSLVIFCRTFELYKIVGQTNSCWMQFN